MIADISFLEARIEEKIKSVKKHQRKNRRTPFYSFLALAIMITGTLGEYLTLSHAATATRNKPFIFQGRITDANYVPLADTTTRKMVFRIYDAATAGNCVWSTGNTNTGDTREATNCAIAITTTGDNAAENNAAVDTTITRGVFSVPLGDTSITNMPDMRLDFNSASFYVEISVKNSSSPAEYESLSPRVRIGSSPYAYNADELDGLNSGSFLRIDGTTTQTASTGGTPTAISFTGAAHTALTAAETMDVNFNLARTVQFTGSTTNGAANITTQRAAVFQSPTYSFSSTGTQTIANAATLAITGMPVAGTNATITNRYGLWMQGDSNATVGQFINVSYPSAVTSTGTTVGSYIDFTNLALGTTSANTFSYGLLLSTPSITNTTTNSTLTNGIAIDGYGNGTSRLTHSGATGQDLWTGLSISMPQQTQTNGTVVSRGVDIVRNAAPTSGITYALTTNENSGNVGIGDSTPDLDLEILNSDTAADGGILITKTDASDRDPILQFSLTDGGVPSYTIGVDDSDSDKLKFGIDGLNSSFFNYDNTQTGLSTANIFEFASFAATFTAAANNFYRMFRLTPAPLTLSGTGTTNAGAISTLDINAMPVAAASATATDAITLYVRGAPTRTSGTLTTSYGILVESGNVGTVTTSYGLYVNAQNEAGANYAGVLRGGNVGIGDTTPDYQLELSAATAGAVDIALSGSDIAHGITTPIAGLDATLQTDMFLRLGSIDPSGGTGGGALIGLSDDAGTAGLYIGGVIGVADPTNSTPAVIVRGSRRNGTNATTTTLDDAETLLTVDNDAFTRMTVLGNGNMGLGVTPATKLDVSGDLALRVAPFTASNGENNNIAIGASSFIRITGPTAAFTITGIAGGVNGKMVIIYNPTGSNMTIAHQSSSSTTEANRIITMTGADVATSGNGSAVLMYSSTDSRWILTSVEQ